MRFLTCAVSLLTLASLLVPGAAKTTQEQPPQSGSLPPTIWLDVKIIDASGNPVNNLNQDQFHVFEDLVPQKLSFFFRNDSPMAYGLAVDMSGSLRSQLHTVITTAGLVIDRVQPDDKLLIIRFISSDKIQAVQDFTADRIALRRAVDALYVEGGLTAIIDAVWFASSRISEYGKHDPRRSLILITDGGDRGSHYKEEQLFAQLRETGLRIFIIGLTSENTGREQDRAVKLLNRLANETGGAVFYLKSPIDIDAAVAQTFRQMRFGYRVGYTSTNQAMDGRWRAIRVEAFGPEGQKLVVRTRPGYFAETSRIPDKPTLAPELFQPNR